MKKTKVISKILFYLTRGLAWVYILTAVYGGISWFTNTNSTIEQDRMIIQYPFTDSSFLILDNHLTYVLFSFLLPVVAYALFFWLLSNAFRVFYQDKLFVRENIVHLQRFYSANIFLPIVLVAFSSFFITVESEMFLIVILHLFLGVFAFFMSEIFNQGLNLQNEQDLYI
ncbi:DUF2975 domain-containing protein [Subsaxibacter sp. CAU 1640]|uniref:DUF2975 domain-containing protein n=1 Tax=Subsaxibacter sp. CAU 1640 TaxID=2933271 RepID=UPI002006D038|nr:DUF2975 domain-containing protein [Subsaxibacter sp. CAU 1640]MCK7590613.1 DUF2975 domain-containing protein [Subsaxibacter sp. CAU 1640]